jgi:hypothetical protein
MSAGEADMTDPAKLLAATVKALKVWCICSWGLKYQDAHGCNVAHVLGMAHCSM